MNKFAPALRLNARLEMILNKIEVPILLTAGGRDSVVLRSSQSVSSNEIIRLSGTPNLSETMYFRAQIKRTFRILEPAEKLEFWRLEGKILDKPDFKNFLSALQKTMAELNEDVRVLLSLPTKLILSSGREIDTTCENVSMGGLYISLQQFEKMPERGDQIHCKVKTPFEDKWIILAGKVRYSVSKEIGKKLNISPGIGVKIDVSELTDDTWQESIHRLRTELFSNG